MAGAVRGGANPSRARAFSSGDARCHRVRRGAGRIAGVAPCCKRRAAGRLDPGARRRDPCRRPCPTARLMPKITFIERDGTRREVDAPIGKSVLEVARNHDIDIEGACEGSLACSTCHVVVDPEWYELLKEASEDEEDMLDLAFNLTTTSRLGCQIVVTDELDGLTVRLPAATRNLLVG